jgi:DHA1 family bicyclomycin/chloramphenicol resistance-like MFS transporter
MGPITIDVYLPGLPQAAVALHTGESDAQLSLTTCLLGLGLGQMVIGPASDRLGRRKPMIAGMAAFAVASALCATASSIVALDAFRFLQGIAGATGIVVSLAIVRDLLDGREAARAYSLLLAVKGLAPVVSPLVGGQLLRIVDWRGLFMVLAGLGLVFVCLAYLGIAETLPSDRRAVGAPIAALRPLTSDRRFLGYALTGAFAFAALFAYISASAFVFQHDYRLSPQIFGVVFAVNGAGMFAANVLNARCVRRLPVPALLTASVVGLVIAAAALWIAAVTGAGEVWGVQAAMFALVWCAGATMPNATALALHDHGARAGSASAVLGALKYLFGAAAAPLVGLTGHGAASIGAVALAAGFLGLAAQMLPIVRSDHLAERMVRL